MMNSDGPGQHGKCKVLCVHSLVLILSELRNETMHAFDAGAAWTTLLLCVVCILSSDMVDLIGPTLQGDRLWVAEPGQSW